MRHLFLVTIGPVQGFIAAARRTRDLWFGSWVLSELSRTAAQTLDDIPHTELIFPTHDSLSNAERQIVNRIVAELPDDRDPKTVGGQVEDAIRLRLKTLRDTTFNRKRNGTNQNVINWPDEQAYRALAEKQVEELLEIVWVAAPIEQDYARARWIMETSLAARKNTHIFKQVNLLHAPEKGRVPKSSIDGARESVIPEACYPDRDDSEPTQHKKIEQLYKDFGAKRAERLSGVDLLKRHGRPEDGDEVTPADANVANVQSEGEANTTHPDITDFPSTSHFAALPFLERLVQAHANQKSPAEKAVRAAKVTTAFQRYRQDLEKLPANQTRLVSLERLADQFRDSSYIEGYDASILFESRLAEEIDNKDDATLRSAQQFLSEFFQAAAGSDRPEPYYALLHADGDNMGKVIDHLAALGIEKHRELSQQLDKFASGVRSIVKAHRGALVYAGGDDVLAFLPLDTTLECANNLAEDFRSKLGQFKFGPQNQQIAPTLSVGIAVVHHLEPLSDALNLARDAEKAAKKVPGKNGLAITVSKRGGVDRTISGSWAWHGSAGERVQPTIDETGDLAWMYSFPDRLTHLIELHQTEAIPDSAAYDLRNLVQRVGHALPLQALKAEAVRIVKRKRGQRGIATDKNAELVKLAEQLPEDAAGVQQWTVEHFANELIVAREFARAKGSKPPTQKEPA